MSPHKSPQISPYEAVSVPDAVSPGTVHELVIIGGGPAALTAAIYAGRAGIETIVYEKEKIGGTLTEISEISNYPGFLGPGMELANSMRQQAKASGAKIEYGECTELTLSPACATKIKATVPHFADNSSRSSVVDTTAVDANFYLTVDAEPVAAQTVIIATGSASRPLDLSLTVPVSYCAVCDGALARDRRVAVVGGGNSAFQESLYLAGLVRELTLITHSQAKADPWLQTRLSRLPNVTIRENLEPTSGYLNQFDHVFVYIGKRPATTLLQKLNQSFKTQSNDSKKPPTSTTDRSPKSSICTAGTSSLLNEAGYIITQNSRTIVPGLFAAGDVCADTVQQVVTAAAAGAEAALSVVNFLKSGR